MAFHNVKTIFRGPLLRVETVECNGSQRARSEEEYATRFEIVFPRSGIYVRHDAEGDVVADTSTALLFYPGHAYEVSHPVIGGDQSVVIAVEETVLLDMLAAFDPGALDRREAPFHSRQVAVSSWERIICASLYHRNLSAISQLEFEEKMLGLLGAMLPRTQDEAAVAAPSTKARTLRQYRDLVHHVKIELGARFHEPLTLDVIAASVYSSPYHLSRIFRQMTGITLHRYLERLRLFASLEILAEQRDIMLTTIAFDLGFSSHSHFSTSFRREFGITPSQFRRSIA